MATILNEQTQYVDASGRPLVGGSVYIGDVNADPVINPKAIFSDRELTAALANPQTLDANGRASNKIWTDGKYSLQVNDINGTQVFQDLDRGESAVTIDILNDITDVITVPANNDTFIITRDESQSKITFANLFAATDTDISDLQDQIDTKAATADTYTQAQVDSAIAAAVAALAEKRVAIATCDGASSPTLSGDDNLSVVRAATGIWEFTFDTAEPDANYNVFASGQGFSSTASAALTGCIEATKATTGFTVVTRNINGVATNYAFAVRVDRA